MLRSAKEKELVLCVHQREWAAVAGSLWQLDSNCWLRPPGTEADCKLVLIDGWPQTMRLTFLERGDCGDDPGFRQIIPYIVTRAVHKGETRVLVYQRKGGGEGRLEAKYSIGVGGHTNPYDAKIMPANLKSLAAEAAEREFYEELPEWLWEHVTKDPDRAEPDFYCPVCWIDDRTNDVGKVHLGVVSVVDIEIDNPEFWETACACVQLDAGVGKFVTWDEALTLRDKLESWSQLLIDAGLNLIQKD